MLFSASLLLLSACERAPSRDRPPRLVLLYAPCTVSRQFLAPYKENVSFTPHLDALAGEAAVLRSHYTEAGQSGISYASLFSGVQADRHGVFRHPAKLDDELLVAAEAFAGAGYETFYWNDHWLASARLNYAQGVLPKNLYQSRPGARSKDGLLEADAPAFAALLDRLASDPGYRAFVVANPVVTHGPYLSRHVARFLREYPHERGGLSDANIKKYIRLYYANHFALSWNFPGTIERLDLDPTEVADLIRVVELHYAANVNHLDRLFGAIVEEVDAHGLRGESLIAFTADHGEVMYRETAPFPFTHGMQLAPEALNVPLLVRGLGAGVKVGPYEAVTRSIDVFPTLAGLSGVAIAPGHAPLGVDISAALRGIEPAPDLPAYSHTTVLLSTVYEQMQDPAKAESWTVARRLFPDENPEHMWVSVVEGNSVHKWSNTEGLGFSMKVFDRAGDPGETRNLYDPDDAKHEDAKARLLAYKEELVRRYEALRGGEANRRLPRRREAEALRALGYIE